MRRSIRVKVTVFTSLIVAAILVITAAALIVLQRSELESRRDAALVQQADAIEQQLAQGRSPAEVLSVGGSADGFAQIVTRDGQVIAAHTAVRGLPPMAGTLPTSDVFDTRTDLPVDDDTFRLLSRPVGTDVLHVAISLDDVHDANAALLGGLGLVIPLATLALAAAVWWTVGRTLRPVEALRSQLADITTQDLDTRVTQPPLDDEIARLASTMNEMLDRLERGARLQRQFVADASHELRSPLTRMRTELEVDSVDADVASLLHETQRMQALVEDLLHLARSDADGHSTDVELVDLDDLVRAELAELDPTVRRMVDVTGLDDAVVRGSPTHLRRMIRNLIENAVRHARHSVQISTATSDRAAILTVEDDGMGIPIEARELVFERFARVDESRSSSDGGTGLGLAIVRDVAERHGAVVAIERFAPRGAAIVVRFPNPVA